jgi:hypothetical protein
MKTFFRCLWIISFVAWCFTIYFDNMTAMWMCHTSMWMSLYYAREYELDTDEL